jgi:hypothetical protein
MDQLRSLPSFSRTIDRQNLRSLSQISSDLQIIFVALNSFSSSSKFLQKFLKPCLEELIWPDDNLVFENKILDLDLIQLVQDRLRCIRSEMVASGWRRESQEINSTTAVTNSQENEKEQLEKSTSSSSSSSLATLICWMLSFLVYFEEAKFYLKERILPQIKKENAKGNDLMIEIKRCLVSVFVEMQSMILAATEISKSFQQKKYEDIFHLVLEIQLSISSSNVEYYFQQQQQTSNSSNGISELATANKNALESWKMLSPFHHQSATKDDLLLELKEFKNEIDEFLSKLLKTNQLFQICFASEIGFPAIFRPAPGDENLAKKKLFENEIL